MVALPQEKSQSRAAFGSAAHASPPGEVAEDQRPEGSTAWRSLALLPALPGAQGQLSQSLCPLEISYAPDGARRRRGTGAPYLVYMLATQ